MADKSSTKIALSDLDAIEQLLDQVPAHRDTSVSKQKAVGILAPKLHAMRAKGYSWNAIAGWLMDHGLSVTPVALQGYLRRVRRPDANASATAPRPRGKRAPESRPTDRRLPVPLTAAPAVATPPAAIAAPPAAKDGAERRSEPAVRRSEFVVRPDTKDI